MKGELTEEELDEILAIDTTIFKKLVLTVDKVRYEWKTGIVDQHLDDEIDKINIEHYTPPMENVEIDELFSLIKRIPASRRSALKQILKEFVEAERAATHGKPANNSAATRTTEKRPSSWSDAKKQGITLPVFVTQAYAHEIATGTLTKATLRADRELYTDYFNWRRRRDLPNDEHWLRDLPTKKEMLDQQPTEVGIDDFDPATQEAVRRYERTMRRAQRRARAPGLR
jgi:hypothetical protein